MIPAVSPAELRTSVKPNRPAHTDRRYPPRVATANPAPAAATILLPRASTAAASRKPVMTCTRNSQPIVGIVRLAGQVQVEVDRRSRGQQPGPGHTQAEPL